MGDSTRAVSDRASRTPEDELEWVPREIAEAPPDPPLFRRFGTSRREEVRPSAGNPSSKDHPLDVELARRLESLADRVNRSAGVIDRSARRIRSLLEDGSPGT